MQDEVEVKARELLADAYDGHEHHFSARQIRAGGSLGLSTEMAIRAIAAAIRQRPVVDDARMARALEWVRAECVVYSNPEARTHLPAIEEAIAAYDPNCGGRTVRVVDDAMVERALTGMLAHRGTFEGESPIEADDVRAALLAAYQQDNGEK